MSRIDDIDWDEVQRLKEQGMSMPELAIMYGVHKDTIRYNTKPITKPEGIDWGTAQALRDAGWTIRKIADYLKTGEEVVLERTHEPKPRKKYENEWNVNEPTIMRHNELI